MLEEAREAPSAIARLLADDASSRALGDDLRHNPPLSILTLARGSSDHAAHYFGYLAMARLGHLVTSLPMSLVTLYRSRLRSQGLASLAFSQSGRSDDLVLSTRALRDAGARTVAFVNDVQSPLAHAAQWVIDLCAGPEASVAATKSYIAQLVASARLVAGWQADAELDDAIALLPDVLARAVVANWSPAVDALIDADRLFVISRGLGLPIAMEAALKFKEVCGIQAEAFSAAEVRHGPMALVDDNYPLFVIAPRGPMQQGLLALAEDMRRRGGRVLLAAPPGTPGSTLPLTTATVEELDPIAAIQSFYPMVEALARARGLDPDAPPHLSKVTRTR